MSQERLLRFVECIRTGATPAPGDMKMIADALEKIVLKGEDPKKALGISPKRGRPHRSPDEWQTLISMLEAVEKYKKQGLTRRKALERVSEEKRVHFDTLEKNYRLWRFLL